MAIAVQPNREFEYQLRADRKEDGSINREGTIWKIRALRSKDRAKIEDGLASATVDDSGRSARMDVKSGSVGLAYLKAGLVGVENFYDSAGNEVEFKAENDDKRHPTRRVASDDFLDCIHEDDQAELARAIKDANRLSETDQKN